MRLSGMISIVAVFALAHGPGTLAAETMNPATKPQTVPMNAREKRNLDFVLKFWREVLYAGHTELIPQYLAPDFVQHKPNVQPGLGGLAKFISATTKPINPIPSKLPEEPVVMAGKGDYVWLIFAPVEKNPFDPAETYNADIMELVRLQDGKIQEQWDTRHKQKGTGPVVEGVSSKLMTQWNTGTLNKLEEKTLETATREFRDMLQQAHLELADNILAENFIQHNANFPQGRAGLVRVMSTRPGRRPEDAKPLTTEWKNPPILTLVNGAYSMMFWQRAAEKDPDDPAKVYNYYHYDMVRVENGMVQEHWDEFIINPPNVAGRMNN
jgi:predicted SnoaL-like aldol condensation-catalyzing enzyme